jgi:hypothetical protein
VLGKTTPCSHPCRPEPPSRNQRPTHLQLTHIFDSRCFCQHSMGTDCTENTASSNSSVVAWLFATAETCSPCCCLAMSFLDPLFRLLSIVSQYPFVSPICCTLQSPSLLLDDCNRVIVVKSLCPYPCFIACKPLMHETITIRETDGNT